ncbi:hypothetical protein [uncultured Mucilaginibacter sp.]|uniref:hypothetical protein n=1 Tax=uncultured Mucilaginibacter sp. TaxID=797541 RepID=UPI0025D55C44|nr:hypothetical protein [uncultured Mucilaginibacter sp.]
MLVLLAADTTELHQLLKLPVLFEHFAEHKERDKSVSFATFISMHYWGNDLNDNDDDRDMQLPFKKLDVHPTHVLFLPTVRTVLNLTPEKHILTNYPVYQHQYFPNPALASPFRPPCV